MPRWRDPQRAPVGVLIMEDNAGEDENPIMRHTTARRGALRPDRELY